MILSPTALSCLNLSTIVAISIIPQKQLTSGKQKIIFRCNNFRFASLICYEDIFPELVKSFAKKDIDFIVVLTNDAWFYRSQSYQRMQMSVLRAVENNIPLIRVSNMGVSGFIDRFGRIKKIKEEEGVFTIQLRSNKNVNKHL